MVTGLVAVPEGTSMSLYPTHRSLSLSNPAGIPANPKPCGKWGRIRPLSCSSSAGNFLGTVHREDPPWSAGVGQLHPDPCHPPAHSPSAFIFSQWRVFLPSLKFEVIDSSYISLYTGKGQVPQPAGSPEAACAGRDGKESRTPRKLGPGGTSQPLNPPTGFLPGVRRAAVAAVGRIDAGSKMRCC